MVVKIYISGMSGSKEVKKRQQRVLMIMDSKNIKYDLVDITEPGQEGEKDTMQTKSTSRGATISDPTPRHPLPPQLFNDDLYCGDYDEFDMANEIDNLEQFLKLKPEEIPVRSTPQPPISDQTATMQLIEDIGNNKENETDAVVTAPEDGGDHGDAEDGVKNEDEIGDGLKTVVNSETSEVPVAEKDKEEADNGEKESGIADDENNNVTKDIEAEDEEDKVTTSDESEDKQPSQVKDEGNNEEKEEVVVASTEVEKSATSENDKTPVPVVDNGNDEEIEEGDEDEEKVEVAVESGKTPEETDATNNNITPQNTETDTKSSSLEDNVEDKKISENQDENDKDIGDNGTQDENESDEEDVEIIKSNGSAPQTSDDQTQQQQQPQEEKQPEDMKKSENVTENFILNEQQVQ